MSDSDFPPSSAADIVSHMNEDHADAVLAIVRAYGRATTGALAPFTYIQIAIMVLLGWAVFGNLPDGATWAGIAIIACAGLYIMARERAGKA